MANKKNKSLILSTLALFLGVVVVALYCMAPTKEISVLEKYEIAFDSDGGGAIAAIQIEEGNRLDEPEAPTKDGYVFVGWMLGDELYDFTQEVEGDMTLKAGWKKIEPDKVYYTVTYNTDGGTPISNQVVEENTVPVAPSYEPVKDGYNFIGWQVDGVSYNFDKPITSDITVVAIWEQKQEEPENPEEPEDPNKTFTVRFNANGGSLGSGCSNQEVKTGEKANNTCTATRSGYTFVGWNTNRSASSANITSRNITANTTFYAIWRSNGSSSGGGTETQTIRVNLYAGTNGSFGGKSDIYRNVQPGTKLNTVLSGVTHNIPKYYELSGWATSRNGSPRVASSITINSAVSYYAIYNKQTFSIGLLKKYQMAGDTKFYTRATISKINDKVEWVEFVNAGRTYNTATSKTGYSLTNSKQFNDIKSDSCKIKFTDSTEIFNCTFKVSEVEE